MGRSGAGTAALPVPLSESRRDGSCPCSAIGLRFADARPCPGERLRRGTAVPGVPVFVPVGAFYPPVLLLTGQILGRGERDGNGVQPGAERPVFAPGSRNNRVPGALKALSAPGEHKGEGLGDMSPPGKVSFHA